MTLYMNMKYYYALPILYTYTGLNRDFSFLLHTSFYIKTHLTPDPEMQMITARSLEDCVFFDSWNARV